MKLMNIIAEMATISEQIDKDFEDVYKHFEDIKGKPLGSGDNGVVFVHKKDNSKVIKFTIDRSEADVANAILGSGEQLKAFNNVHEVRTSEEHGVWIITSDRCNKMLDHPESYDDDDVDDSAFYGGDMSPEDMENAFYGTDKEEKEVKKNDPMSNEERLKFIKDLQKDCDIVGVDFERLDVTDSNIMRHPGTLTPVLVDFGFSGK